MSHHVFDKQSSTTSSSSFKTSSSSVSVIDSSELHHQQAPFTSLIENEKQPVTAKHDEFVCHQRLLITGDDDDDDHATTITNPTQQSSGVSYDRAALESEEDDVECEEIHRITQRDDRGAQASSSSKVGDDEDEGGPTVDQLSPEPSNDELGNIRGTDQIQDFDQHDDDDHDEGGVEFQEFEPECATNMSSKTVKSSMMMQQQQMSVSSSVSSKSSMIQHQSSLEKSEQQQQLVSSEQSINNVVAAVQDTAGVESTTALVEQTSKKSAKVERKTSKAGNKKNKSNAEISKENISVLPQNNSGEPPTKSFKSVSPTSGAIPIPEDLVKKLGPGESRVFAKVCVANLRRSFGDLTVISSGGGGGGGGGEPASPPLQTQRGASSLEYHGFVKPNMDERVRSSSLRIGSGGGPSSLPTTYSLLSSSSASSNCSLRSLTNNNNSSSNKLQLFQPKYWEQLLCASNNAPPNIKKSSFSKFDNLAKSNEQKQNGSITHSESAARIKDSVEGDDPQPTKAETKKMFCTSCEKQVFQMELVRAEKKDWHKNCFRCVTCRKVLSVDTYQSHEHKLYCKPHFKELFQPKAVVEDEADEVARLAAKPKLQLIICESQPKELPPDVVRASDTPATGLEDIQIDVRSKFELFENLKETETANKNLGEPLPVKRSASVLAKLKKYENSLTSGGSELNGVSDEDFHGGADGIELQSDEEEEEEDDDEENSVIKAEIRRKLKNPLQALNEIAHFKQMEQVRSKWEDGGVNSRDHATDQRKEELQKFRSRLCQGKSNQLKEMYEKALETEPGTTASRQEVEELKSERSRLFREMFEKGEVRRVADDDDEDEADGGGGEDNNSLTNRPKSGVDLEVFEAGVAKESRSMFEKLDKRVNEEMKTENNGIRKATGNRPNAFVRKPLVVPSQFEPSSPTEPLDVVRSSDKHDEPVKVNTAELSNKFKFFETYEDEQAKKSKESKRDTLKRITPPREDGIVKTDKDYADDEDAAYRDPNVVRHSESVQDDTLQKSRTASKMLNIFRQMEENLSKGEAGSKDPIIRPLKQFTPPRDTAPRVYNSGDEDEEEEEEEEQEPEDEEEEEEEEGADQDKHDKDEFLKEVGSLARARSLRAKFERWEQQENERNKQNGSVQEELAESIESARNLKAKFEAMRLMGDNKENGKGASPVQLRVNRFVLNSNNASQDFEYGCEYPPASLPVSLSSNGVVTGGDHHHNNHHHHQQQQPPSSLIMSSSEQCAMCEKRVYVMEKIEAGGKMYHKNCFRCSQCKCILRMDTFTSNKGTLFCTTHFKQLFKIKGNYDEGFGHETQYQVWAKKQHAAAQQN